MLSIGLRIGLHKLHQLHDSSGKHYVPEHRPDDSAAADGRADDAASEHQAAVRRDASAAAGAEGHEVAVGRGSGSAGTARATEGNGKAEVIHTACSATAKGDGKAKAADAAGSAEGVDVIRHAEGHHDRATGSAKGARAAVEAIDSFDESRSACRGSSRFSSTPAASSGKEAARSGKKAGG